MRERTLANGHGERTGSRAWVENANKTLGDRADHVGHEFANGGGCAKMAPFFPLVPRSGGFEVPLLSGQKCREFRIDHLVLRVQGRDPMGSEGLLKIGINRQSFVLSRQASSPSLPTVLPIHSLKCGWVRLSL